MKIIARFSSIVCILLATIFSVNAQDKNNQPDEVYLLIGQSNMAGRGVLDEKNTQVVSENILMLDKANNWVLAKNPLHFDKEFAGVGPGLGFAQKMLKSGKKIKIGLIPCAWGGSPIDVWVSGAVYLDHKPYDEAIERAKIAMQTGKLKGILWHQGESDNKQEKADIYLQKLQDLVANLRRDLNNPNLPFVAGEIGRFNPDDFINPIINKIPNVIINSAVVSSEGLTDKGDHLHFDSASAYILGERYAEAMSRLLKKKSKK